MSRHDRMTQHMREIIEKYSHVIEADDRKALRKYEDELKVLSNYLEREENRIKETYRILKRLTDRMTPSTPAWIRTGIFDAIKELKK